MAIYFYIDDDDIDVDAFQLSEKILTVALAALLTAINSFLIVLSLVRCCKNSSDVHNSSTTPVRRTKHIVLMSLAVGGIVQGLFTNVVFAVILFEQESNQVGCTTSRLARIFEDEFLPVVYSCGLIIFILDITHRSKPISSHLPIVDGGGFMNNFFLASLLAFLPWAIALIIVCPLTLTKTDWGDYCHLNQSDRQMQARLIVLGIGPAFLALASSVIFVLFVGIGSRTAAPARRRTNFSHPDSFDCPMVESQGYRQYTFDSATSRAEPVKNRYVFQIDKEMGTASSSTDYPDSNRNQQYDLMSPCYEKENDTPSWRHDTAFTSLRFERNVLIFSCVIFMVTVVPYNALSLYAMQAYKHNGHFVYTLDSDIAIALITCFWVKGIYPVLMPLLWVVY